MTYYTSIVYIFKSIVLRNLYIRHTHFYKVQSANITLPLFNFSALLISMVVIRSLLFKHTSITLKSSLHEYSLPSRICFTNLDFWRILPLQFSISEIADLSSTYSIIAVAWSGSGSSSWRRVKLCCMQRMQLATNNQFCDLRKIYQTHIKNMHKVQKLGLLTRYIFRFLIRFQCLQHWCKLQEIQRTQKRCIQFLSFF